MSDKIKSLASIIVNYSLELKSKDKVLILMETLLSRDLVIEIINLINEIGSTCIIKVKDPIIDALLLENTTPERIKVLKDINNFEVKNFDCFINIKCNQNDYEDHLINKNITNALSKELEHDNDIKINKKRWVLLNYPSNVDAFKAKMKYHEFYDYALNAMIHSFKDIKEATDKLKRLMEQTENVRIVTPDTELRFSIKDINVVPCLGEKNIPDGEIYVAPIKNSVNGHIKYNIPSPYRGEIFNNIYFEFKDGKIIKAECDSKKLTSTLNEILDTDEGSRYIGEFAIGLNPLIDRAMGDILFDEKILGSIHFTPGRCYQDSNNKNKSNIHWDLVLNMNIDHGGGSIYFDDKLIQENGIFIPEELKDLNKKAQ